MRSWLALDLCVELIQRGFEFGHLRINVGLDLRHQSYLSGHLQVLMHFLVDLLRFSFYVRVLPKRGVFDLAKVSFEKRNGDDSRYDALAFAASAFAFITCAFACA